jgi:CDP-diacylglycerol---serine O-phosphatidyltransferase
MKQIPNIFTLLNLFFGCCAIVFTLQTSAINVYQGESLATSFSFPEELYYACICIGIAAVIDFLDGFVARLLNATSEMGKQLDSLSDVVSFGAAPSMILYQLLRMSHLQEANSLDKSILWLLPAFVFACAGAYRLARFNVHHAQVQGFKGLPIPAAGLLVASLPLIVYYNYFNGYINVLLFNKWFLYIFIAIVSGLMLSTLPLIAFKFEKNKQFNRWPTLILLIVGLIAIVALKWLAVPVILLTYIVVSLIFKNSTT